MQCLNEKASHHALSHIHEPHLIPNSSYTLCRGVGNCVQCVFSRNGEHEDDGQSGWSVQLRGRAEYEWDT